MLFVAWSRVEVIKVKRNAGFRIYFSCRIERTCLGFRCGRGGKNKVNYDLSLKLVNSYLKQEEEELGV